MQLYYRIFIVNTRKQQNFDLICNIFCFIFLNLNNHFILQVEQFILVDNYIVICKKFNCNMNLMFNTITAVIALSLLFYSLYKNVYCNLSWYYTAPA